MKLYKYSLNAAAGLAGLAAISGNAQAADVDYGSLEQLFNEPVTTSATGAPQRATEAPVNMTIFTQEQIRQSGARTIPEVLQRMASVDVMQYLSGQSEVAVHGYDQPFSPRLLVLVNGRQVYLDDYGMTNWDTIPVQLAEIRQIEVVVGPNTALFGFNAVAGVVNIITFDTLRDDVDAAQATSGSSKYFGSSLVLSGQLNDRIGARLSVGGADSELTDEDLARSASARDPSSNAASLNVGARLTPSIRTDFEATYSRDEDVEMIPGSSILPHNYETSSYKGSISAETSLGLVDAQVYQNELHVDVPSIIGFDNDITVASVGLVAKPAPAHTLRFAVEYRRNEFSQRTGYSLFYDVFSESAMWNWQASSKFALTTALRSDALQLDASGSLPSRDYAHFTELSYNVGGVYRLSDNDSLRVSLARGIQSPSLLDYTFMVTNAGAAIKPTVVQNYEIGWDHNLAAINGRLRTSIYYQTNENFSTLSFSGGNVGDSDLTGVDIGVEGVQGQVRWGVQYSHRILNDDPSAPLNVTQTGYEQSTPQNVITANANWVSGVWEVGGDLRYVDATRQYVDNVLPYAFADIGAYTSLNARIAWHATDKMRVELIGRNLADDSAQTTSGAAVPRAAYIRLSADF